MSICACSRVEKQRTYSEMVWVCPHLSPAPGTLGAASDDSLCRTGWLLSHERQAEGVTWCTGIDWGIKGAALDTWGPLGLVWPPGCPRMARGQQAAIFSIWNCNPLFDERWSTHAVSSWSCGVRPRDAAESQCCRSERWRSQPVSVVCSARRAEGSHWLCGQCQASEAVGSLSPGVFGTSR